MKVHHILSETLDVKQIDGMWRVFDTVKNAVVGDIGFATAGEAEAERDRLRVRPAADTGANNRANTPSQNSFSADPRPGTPNSDQLTKGEQRKLSRSGSITRGGVTYTRANIAAADAERGLLRAVAAKEPALQGDTRPSRNAPVNNVKSGIVSNLGSIWNSKTVKFFRGVLSAKAMTTLNTAFNAVVLEDVLDAYLRAIKDHGASLNNASQSEKDQYIQMLTGGDIAVMPTSVKIAYLNAIEQTRKVLVEAIVGLILGLGWGGIVALGAFGIGTGGLGILASIAAGGAFIIGGTALITKILEEVGVNDAVEDWIASELLSPMIIFKAAQGVDGWQEFLAAGADVGTSWLTGNTIGNLIRDDINEESTPTVGKIDPNAAEQKLKDLVRSNPELMQAYKDGKEKAKAEMRSTTTAS